jgi:hypothetical protein
VDAGTVAVDSTGLKTITISETVGDGNDQGLVWAAYLSDGDPALKQPYDFTMMSPLGVRDHSAMAAYGHLYRAFTYGSLPDPGGAPDYRNNGGVCIWFRIV